jgi:nitroimidazol reductase NimA-like FMN-containing flavoprotein (pyridoxamine 5'-phosphate oxidase superfamily)
MSLAMSEHERQEFLAGVHVGVISIERVDGPPLTVPIWYGYEPGGLVWIITGAESLKGKLLNAARRFSLCAQTEEPPFYKYVSVEGPIVAVTPVEPEADRRPLAHRYFGPELGDAYVASNASEGGLKFSMRPTRWWSIDYSKVSPSEPLAFATITLPKALGPLDGVDHVASSCRTVMASLLGDDGSLPLDRVEAFHTLDRIATWAEQYE